MNDLPASSYDGVLERTADGGVIRFERHLPYPIGDVWDAITNPARLADWWLPFDADITVDLREGGQLAGRPVAWDWDGFAEAQAHYANIGLAPPVDAL